MIPCPPEEQVAAVVEVEEQVAVVVGPVVAEGGKHKRLVCDRCRCGGWEVREAGPEKTATCLCLCAYAGGRAVCACVMC